MSLMRWIRGYDRHTEVLKGEWEIPSYEAPWVQRYVGGKADDPDFLDPYPLTATQMRVIIGRLALRIDPTAFEYYMEADENWNKVAEMRDAQQPNP